MCVKHFGWCRVPEGMKQHLGLAAKKCVPCEAGKAKALSDTEVNSYRNQTPGWQIITNVQGHRCLRQQWKVKNFQAGLEVFGRIGRIAEEEGHHPDLHLEGYNTVAADLSTHSVGEWDVFPHFVCNDCREQSSCWERVTLHSLTCFLLRILLHGGCLLSCKCSA